MVFQDDHSYPVWGGKGMDGYDALDCTMISRGLYNKPELCFLPDMAARFLFEFHADDYSKLRKQRRYSSC
jgi:hypothetical protein